jgi:hypothetical protein
MLFAEWIGEIQSDGLGNRMAYKGDIIEVYARCADGEYFVCKGNRSTAYFWGKEKYLEWCSNVCDDDILFDEIHQTGLSVKLKKDIMKNAESGLMTTEDQ